MWKEEKKKEENHTLNLLLQDKDDNLARIKQVCILKETHSEERLLWNWMLMKIFVKVAHPKTHIYIKLKNQLFYLVLKSSRGRVSGVSIKIVFVYMYIYIK